MPQVRWRESVYGYLLSAGAILNAPPRRLRWGAGCEPPQSTRSSKCPERSEGLYCPGRFGLDRKVRGSEATPRHTAEGCIGGSNAPSEARGGAGRSRFGV